MSASNPNHVTFINETGYVIPQMGLCHSASIAIPTTARFVLNGSNVAMDASLKGTAKVADGLADYWASAMVALTGPATANLLWLSPLPGVIVPWKICNSPDNGSTVIRAKPPQPTPLGTTIPATIETYHSDGSSDGTCQGWYQDISSKNPIYGPLLRLLTSIMMM